METEHADVDPRYISGPVRVIKQDGVFSPDLPVSVRKYYDRITKPPKKIAAQTLPEMRQPGVRAKCDACGHDVLKRNLAHHKQFYCHGKKV
jgi:hypothetical protein